LQINIYKLFNQLIVTVYVKNSDN